MATLTYSAQDYYLAGLFDGEGTVGVYHRPENPDGQYKTRVVAAVSMCDKEPLSALAARFGGGLIEEKPTLAGRRLWKWYIVGCKAKEALGVFEALCLVKSAQARLALEAIGLIEATKNRPRRKRITFDEEIRRREIAVEVKRLKAVA